MCRFLARVPPLVTRRARRRARLPPAAQAWNSDMDDMLCWSGNGTLCIRTGDFPPSEQKMQGFVVGFRGSKIFCLHFISMQSIDVPQSASVYRYLEKRQIDKAYEVACLGVTDADWRHLAMIALESLETEPARKAFGRLRDVRFMELISRIEAARKKGEPDQFLKGEALAYAGKFKARVGGLIPTALRPFFCAPPSLSLASSRPRRCSSSCAPNPPPARPRRRRRRCLGRAAARTSPDRKSVV